MNIGIIGTRKRDSEEDLELAELTFHKIINMFMKNGTMTGGLEDIKIISGGCPKGGDRFAEVIHNNLQLTADQLVIHYPAKVKPGSPRYAYTNVMYDRNDLIARDSDVLIALVDDASKKGGTRYTIKKFKDITPMGSLKCFEI